MNTLPIQLQHDINKIIQDYPPSSSVFESLIQHFKTDKKKPIIEQVDAGPLLHSIPDLSFTNPIRKKCALDLHQHALKCQEFALLFENVSDLFLVPTPNKSKPHYTFIFFSTSNGSHAAGNDMVMFGMDGSVKDQVVNTLLKISCLKSRDIKQPNLGILSSAASTKAKPVFHIQCYLKTKEGFLYFFASGILFGFKKPVLYFPIGEIHSMSVQTITGRTFCLVLKTSNEESIEFDMIDTSEYQGISDYMTRFSISGPQIPKESSSTANENETTIGQVVGIGAEEEESTDEDYQESTSSEDVSDDSDSNSDSDAEQSVSTNDESQASHESVLQEHDSEDEHPLELDETTASDENNVKPLKITGMSQTADAIMKQLQKQKVQQPQFNLSKSKNKRLKTSHESPSNQESVIILDNSEEEEIDELED